MALMETSLEGKTAWVTGASRGVGRAIAIALAKEGVKVALGARSLDEMRQIVEVIKSDKGEAECFQLDVANRESVKEFSASAVKAFGAPDILINNAGYGLFKEIDRLDEEEFDQQVDVTLKGTWYTTKSAVPHMKKQGYGRIINISSIAGKVSFARGSAYCAAKAGLNAMSEALMLELREFGISVSVLAPGSIQTSFHQQALPQANFKDNNWMLLPENVAESCIHILKQPDGVLVNYYETRPLTTGKSA